MTYLRGLAGDRRFTARFSNKFPWMRLSYETRVPIDFISQLAEDVFYRFAGRGTAETTDVPRMKDILLYTRAKKLTVESARGLLPVSLDGEVIERKRFTVEIVPGGVNFALPKAKE